MPLSSNNLKWIFAIALTALFSCNAELTQVEETFKLPVIKQVKTNDTINYFKGEYMSEVSPVFVMKSKFCDTLYLPIKREQDTIFENDRVNEYDFKITDTLSSDGFELFTDYKTTIPWMNYWNNTGNYYYPVYVVNQTPTTKIFYGKDGYVFAIQEALDSNRVWRPIERRAYDFCGMGHWGLKVHPKEFLTFLMPKYQGEYKTRLRVRLKIDENIYVSNSFDGTIDKKQLYPNKNDIGDDRQIMNDKASMIVHSFYGAEPY